MNPDVDPFAASVTPVGAVLSPAAVVTAALLACLSVPLWAQSLDGESRGRPQAAVPAAACAAFTEPLRALPAHWRAPVCQAAAAGALVQVVQLRPSTWTARAAIGLLR
jgi:hypothetical protein